MENEFLLMTEIVWLYRVPVNDRSRDSVVTMEGVPVNDLDSMLPWKWSSC